MYCCFLHPNRYWVLHFCSQQYVLQYPLYHKQYKECHSNTQVFTREVILQRAVRVFWLPALVRGARQTYSPTRGIVLPLLICNTYCNTGQGFQSLQYAIILQYIAIAIYFLLGLHRTKRENGVTEVRFPRAGRFHRRFTSAAEETRRASSSTLLHEACRRGKDLTVTELDYIMKQEPQAIHTPVHLLHTKNSIYSPILSRIQAKQVAAPYQYALNLAIYYQAATQVLQYLALAAPDVLLLAPTGWTSQFVFVARSVASQATRC